MIKKLFISAILAVSMLGIVSCRNVNKEASEADNVVAEAVDPDNEKNPFEIKDNVIFNENVPVVVDFYADWCGPCKQYSPIFQKIAEKYGEAACFVSINIDEYSDLSKTYEISSIPSTVFIMPGGNVLDKLTGVIPADTLETLVNQFLATCAGADMEI